MERKEGLAGWSHLGGHSDWQPNTKPSKQRGFREVSKFPSNQQNSHALKTLVCMYHVTHILGFLDAVVSTLRVLESHEDVSV